MREHDGHLYLGGLANDRVGRIRLSPPGPSAAAETAGAATAVSARG